MKSQQFFDDPTVKIAAIFSPS